ncbi:MAG: hypothetical protein JXA43_02305 [Candidatus Diapherotrites archaeon]|nr:hypothetical protein [Candidatus Diapherotrites archaeon]
MITGKSDSVFVAISLAVIFCLLLVPIWGILSPKISFISMELLNHDKVIYGDSISMVSFQMTPYNTSSDLIRDVKIYTNDNLVFKKEATITPDEPTRMGLMLNGSEMQLGDNLITITAGEKSLFYHIEKREGTGISEKVVLPDKLPETESQDPLSPIKLPLFFALFFIPGCFLFRHKVTLERLALTFALGCTLFIITPWVLNYGGLLNSLNLILALGFISLLAIVMNYKKKAPKEKNVEINRIMLLVCAGIILAGILMLFLPSHYNLWNVFYERYSEQMIGSGTIPMEDPFSYLGRGYTFVEGYFLFSAASAWITGYSGTMVFGLVQAMLNGFFIISVLNFGRSLGFKLKEQLLVLLFLLASVFIFVTFAMSPKHILALALLLTATAYMIERDKFVISGGLAAMAAYSQALMGVMYPILYLLFVKKTDWPKFLKSIAIMLLVFAIIYLPIYAHSGLPYEVNESTWGYLIKADVSQAITDLGGLVAVLLIIGAAATIGKWKKIKFRQKKIILFTLLFVFAEIFITYRANIFLSLTLAVGFIYAFKDNFKDKWLYIVILLIALFSIYLNFQVLQWSTLDEALISSGTFINLNSNENARILSDPLYGHAVTYFAQRPALSDLYVEYASEEKLNDTYDFIINENLAVLQKYKIDYVMINRNSIINEARNVINYPKPKEFTTLDKIISAKEIDVYATQVGNYGQTAN